MATDAAAGSIHEEDALGKVYDGRLVRRLLAYVRPYMPLVFFALVALLAEALLNLVGPTLTKRVVDHAEALGTLRDRGLPLPAHPTAFIWHAVLIFALALVA